MSPIEQAIKQSVARGAALLIYETLSSDEFYFERFDKPVNTFEMIFSDWQDDERIEKVQASTQSSIPPNTGLIIRYHICTQLAGSSSGDMTDKAGKSQPFRLLYVALYYPNDLLEPFHSAFFDMVKDILRDPDDDQLIWRHLITGGYHVLFNFEFYNRSNRLVPVPKQLAYESSDDEEVEEIEEGFEREIRWLGRWSFPKEVGERVLASYTQAGQPLGAKLVSGERDPRITKRLGTHDVFSIGIEGSQKNPNCYQFYLKNVAKLRHYHLSVPFIADLSACMQQYLSI